MNYQSIQKIRLKFIMIAMSSFFVVMIFTGFMVNIANVLSVRRQARTMLNYLVETGGEIWITETDDEESGDSKETVDTSSLPKEFRYSTRYFAIFFDEEGNVVQVKDSYISALDEESEIAMAEDALDNFFKFNQIGDYYYQVASYGDDATIVAFLDMSLQTEINDSVIRSTVLICAAGFLITFIIVLLFSNKAIQPEIENAARQKQFITNASHELKTPLAVIRANTELIEMLSGENEWTQSTMRQVDHMNGLIQNLVMIARAEEEEDKNLLIEVDVTRAVRETVEPFMSLATQEHKELGMELTEDVFMIANGSKIRQLTSILVDNAIKYCDENGQIKVGLEPIRRGKNIRLTVSNTYEAGVNVDYTKFFDRFYREDQSHNKSTEEKGGYGIGLSMAESICKSYHGSIGASWSGGVITFTCVLNGRVVGG